jgi:hypothetical protein
MKQSLENTTKKLNDLGFPIDVDAPLFSLEQLHMPHASGLTFIDYLLIEDNPEVQALQDDKDFTFIFLRSLKYHQINIPQNWLALDDFSMVCEPDKMIVHEEVANGLYHYCTKYQDEHQFPFERIVRKNGHHALLFSLDRPSRHLTIDETISSLSREDAVFTYAHVTDNKGLYTLRYYFNHDLVLSKTTATDNRSGHKIHLNEREDIHPSIEDYRAELEILRQLKMRHRDKIEALDLQLKPIFFFISNAEVLHQCTNLISEINALKSPIYDQRQRILQRFKDHGIQRVEALMPSESSRAEEPQKDVAIAHRGKKSKAHKKPQVAQPNQQRIQELLQREINQIAHAVQSPTLPIANLEQLFQGIQNFEILLIHHYGDITTQQKIHFESILQDSKDRMIKHIHQAFIAGQFHEIDALYEVANEYIDGLLIGLIQSFQKQLVQILNPSENEQQGINQLLDLIMHFYPKNSFYRAYLRVLSSQYGFSESGIPMYSMLMRIIYVLDDPRFIFFLIQENLFSATDCICVNEYKYLSLIQFLLIGMKHLHPSFLNLLKYFHANHASIIDVTHIDMFQSFIEKPDAIKGAYLAQHGKAHTRSDTQSLQRICSSLTNARVTSLIDFGGTYPFHDRRANHAYIAQDFMLENPCLAFLYLANLLNKPDIFRRTMLGNGNNLAILSAPHQLNHVTAFLSPNFVEDVGMNYIYYPNTMTSAKSVDSIIMACEFIDKLKDQPYVKERAENPAWLAMLYEAALSAPQTTVKSNGILGVILYLILIPHWSPDTFKKYCFYNSKRIDCLIEANFSYQHVATDFMILIDLMKANKDEATKNYCLKFIESKLERLIGSIPQLESVKSQLFP